MDFDIDQEILIDLEGDKVGSEINWKKKIPLPDYTLSSALTLKMEYRVLPSNDPESTAVPKGKLPTGINKLPIIQELSYYRSKGFSTTKDIISLLSVLRQHWTPDQKLVKGYMNEVIDSLGDQETMTDLLNGLQEVFTGTGTFGCECPTLNLKFGWDYLMKSLLERDCQNQMIRWMFIARVLEVGLIWANHVEQYGETARGSESYLQLYGWSIEKDGEICSLSQIVHLETGSDILLHLTPRAFGMTIVGSTVGYSASKKYLLCEKDVYTQRWISTLIASLHEKWQAHRLPSVKTLMDLYSYGDKILIKGGNAGFDLIKALETFFLSEAQVLAEKDDPEPLSGSLKTFIVESIMKLGKDLGVSKEADQFFKLTTDLGTNQLLELSGCFRHWGHPTIHVEEGLVKVHENATKNINVNVRMMTRLASMMQYMLYSSYASKHMRKWPKGTKVLSPTTPRERILHEMIKRNRFPSKEAGYHLQEAWLNLQGPPIFSKVEDINVLELIADKRHARPKSELQSFVGTERSFFWSGSESVIETMLMTPEVDVLEFLNEVDRNGIDRDYLIIILKEKERELKIQGRFFSLMTFPLRLYFTATEFLLEKYILPLFPEITMCKDQLDFTKQMLHSTERTTNFKTVSHHMISIDFEKWNNFQRHESTFPVFKVIDNAFGWERVISRTHEIFQECTIIYGGRLDMVPKDFSTRLPYCWNDHLGGFEGLRQKGWSIVGALMIREVSLETTVKTRVLLQGDNQVIILRYIIGSGLSEEQIQEIKSRHKWITQRFLSIFSTVCQSVGLTTKPEETWISGRLLYYGKWAFIDGVSMPLYLKRLCRIFAVTNDLVPSLSNCISSLNTACLAACAQVSWSGPTYVFYIFYGMFLIGNMMHLNPITSQPTLTFLRTQLAKYKRADALVDRVEQFLTLGWWCPKRDHSHLTLALEILMRDSSLGGIGGSGPLRYTLRQFPDPVCETLTGLRIMYRMVSTPFLKRLLWALGNPAIAPDINFEILLQDPTALNLLGFSRSNNMIKDFVKKQLFTYRQILVRNNFVREALYFSNHDKPKILEFLEGVQPCFPRFLSSLIAASPVGICETVISKFVGTRASFGIAARCSTLEELRAKIRENEANLIISILNHHLNGLNCYNSEIWPCSTQHAQELRRHSWRREVLGVTVPHPAEQWALTFEHRRKCLQCTHGGEFDKESILIIADEGEAEFLNDLHYSKGPFEAYLGGRTIERRVAQTEIEMSTSAPVIRGFINLLNYQNWCYEKKSLIDVFVRRIGEIYLPGYSEWFDQRLQIHSGSIMHRFRNPRVSDGAGNPNNPNLNSHVCCTSNYLRRLGRGEENFVILFQAVFLHWENLFLMNREARRIIRHQAHIHPSCNGCLLPAPDLHFEAEQAPPELTFGQPHLDIVRLSFRHKAPIPVSHQLKERPFEISADRVYINPQVVLQFFSETDMTDEARESAVYLGATLVILSKLNMLDLYGAVSDYKLSTGTVRKLKWAKLSLYLAEWTLRAATWRAALQKAGLTPGSRLVEPDPKRIAINSWARLDEIRFGVVLENSGVDFEVMRERVCHSASYPLKTNQIGRSGILSIIERLRLYSKTLAAHRHLIVPGDFDTSACYCYLRLLNSFPTLSCDQDGYLKLTEKLHDLFSFLEDSVPLSSVQTLDTVKDAVGEAFELLGSRSQYSILRLDLKSLSELMETPHEDQTVNPSDLWIGPNIDSVKEPMIAYDSSRPNLISEANPFGSGGQTPMLHFFRPVWHSANGSVKILSVVKGMGEWVLKWVAVVGDGNGGFTRTLANLDFVEKVWFNSLPDYKNSSNQNAAQLMPSALLGHSQLIDKLVNKDILGEITNDLTKDEWAVETRNAWIEHQFTPTLILCDAELYDYELLKRILKNFWKLRDLCGRVLVKIHLNEKHPLRTLIPPEGQMSRLILWRSAYSHCGKYEVYCDITWSLKGSSASIITAKAVPYDFNIMEKDAIFLRKYYMQLGYIRQLRLPLRRMRERAISSDVLRTLRVLIGDHLSTPVDWLYELEERYRCHKTHFLEVLGQLLDWITERALKWELMHNYDKDFRSETAVGRHTLQKWLATLTTILIVCGAYIQHLETYMTGCNLYTSGGRVLIMKTSLNSVGVFFSSRGVEKDRNPGEIDFVRDELKRYVHDLCKYLSGIYWCTGVNHFGARERFYPEEKKHALRLIEIGRRKELICSEYKALDVLSPYAGVDFSDIVLAHRTTLSDPNVRDNEDAVMEDAHT